MSAKEQLRQLQTALEKRGVVDVKFFFGHSAKPLSGLASDAVEMLDAVVNNRFDKAAPFRDSVRI